MTEDERSLVALLERAAELAEPPTGFDLSAVVQGGRRRERRRRGALAAGVVGGFALVGGLVLWPGGGDIARPPAASDQTPDPSASLDPTERVQSEIDATAADLSARLTAAARDAATTGAPAADVEVVAETSGPVQDSPAEAVDTWIGSVDWVVGDRTGFLVFLLSRGRDEELLPACRPDNPAPPAGCALRTLKDDGTVLGAFESSSETTDGDGETLRIVHREMTLFAVDTVITVRAATAGPASTDPGGPEPLQEPAWSFEALEQLLMDPRLAVPIVEVD